MNPFFSWKRNRCLPALILFLFVTGLLPVFAADYGRPLGHGYGQELEEDELGQPTHKPDQLGKPGDKPDQLGKPGHKPDQLGKPGHKPDQLGKPGDKPDQLGKPGHKPDQLGKPGDKPDQLGKPGDKPDQLGKPGHKPDQTGQAKSPAEKPRAGDIALQIANDTDFALFVRASIVDASERVNLAKAKSASLAAHTRESVVLTPMSAGKVSLTPTSSKTEISRDSKILLTINKGKETRRLVLGYAQSGGMIVLGKDLFPQTNKPSHRSKLPTQSEESEKLQQKPISSVKAQTVYVINHTGTSVNYNALLKPANFDPVQGELKPGTNVLKFSAKKSSRSLSKQQISLILQMKYNLPGSPTVTFKKEAFDLDSQPTVTLTKTIMGEPIGQAQTKKKLK